MKTSTLASAWPRISYWALWVIGVIGIIVGIILLSAGSTVEWVPTGVPDTYEAHPLSLVPVGAALTAGGSLVIVTLLILEAFVGPLHRRGDEGAD
ncbi:hypothetical protein LQ938_01455 [Microbacterium sp. cx-55]|uniref:hypothetical protein n=1 Tax=Microbacterium sp. cx-55 TaxID=2875948 RepID=UPI001CC1AC7F|nr:hypothetical protein [Microbacterium sp. cx-55]MBZ4487471.1 hypothetical protein [Microbacterium sp. cx-55]UGB35491.1 hypothetical protein LQ938_01455 [Microbacterium sp. cx-55]